uniref:FAD-binding FR-type domain-containing protein n=1 Tax=Denticeps clupeoides TaxID=299321 RepID=A0AAY4BG15_9TELE
AVGSHDRRPGAACGVGGTSVAQFEPATIRLWIRVAGKISQSIIYVVSRLRVKGHRLMVMSSLCRQALFPARVTGIGAESQTVRRLRLEVTDPDFSFRAGQWVDLFIPGVEKVGGFSICSAPGLLQREGVLELAVKYAQHPPAHWVHTQVSVRKDLHFLQPFPGWWWPGVTTSTFCDTHTLTHTARCTFLGTHLCYSAKNTEELLFKSSIVEVCEEFPDYFSCQLHVTQQRGEIDHKLQPYTICEYTHTHTHTYNHNIKSMSYCVFPVRAATHDRERLHPTTRLGLSEDRIRYEKWW